MRLFCAGLFLAMLCTVSFGQVPDDAPAPPRLVRRHPLTPPVPSHQVLRTTDLNDEDWKTPVVVDSGVQLITHTETDSASPKSFPAQQPPQDVSEPTRQPMPQAFPFIPQDPTGPKSNPSEFPVGLFDHPAETLEKEIQPMPPDESQGAVEVKENSGLILEVVDGPLIERARTAELITVPDPAPLLIPPEPTTVLVAAPPPPEPDDEDFSSSPQFQYSPMPVPASESPMAAVDHWQPANEFMAEPPYYEMMPDSDDVIYGVESISDDAAYNDLGIAPVVSLAAKVGNDRTIFDVRSTLPLWQSDLDLLFADVRGRFDDAEANEGHFGLGFRTLMTPNWIGGAYAYYDLRRTTQRNHFHQLTTGLELLSVDWDIRVNNFLPDQGSHGSNRFMDLSNGTIQTFAFRERAPRGLNVEVGKRLLHWGWNDDCEVRGFAGYYYFDHSSMGSQQIEGPSARLEFRWHDLDWFGPQSRLVAAVEYTSDDVRDEQTWAMLRLNIPLSPRWSRAPLDPLTRRFADLPRREID